jgi:isocitrate dehydrogenase (NAD+)
MLRHLGEQGAATTLESAVSAALSGPVKTADVGGTASTEEYADYVIKCLAGPN